MPHWTEIDLKQTRFYQDVFAEGYQEGYQEGYREALILRILRRCGELSPALTEHISQLSLPQLRDLSEALLEFRGTADLEQWLNQPTRAWHSSVRAKPCFSPSQALPGKAK